MRPYMGIRFWSITQPFFVQFQKERYPRVQETSSYKLSTHKLCFELILILRLFWPKKGVATLRAAMVTGGRKPPQKFGYRSIFFGQLLSQK